HHWRLAMVVFVGLACLATNLKSLRLSVQTLGVSIVILACIANVFGDMTTGRLTLPQGKFGNPNDLAEIMLMGFPFLIYILDTGNLFLKLTSMGGMLILLVAMARTGSRGASLALVIVIGFVFLRSTVQARILMVAAAIVALAAAVALLPHSLRD